MGDDDDGDGDASRGTVDVGCDDEFDVDAFRFGIGGGGDDAELPSDDDGVDAADDDEAIFLTKPLLSYRTTENTEL